MGFDKKLADDIMDEVFRYEYEKKNRKYLAGTIMMLLLVLSATLFGIKNIHMNKTVDLRINLMAPQATSVRVVGDFNEWNRPGVKMVAAGNGRWTAEITVDPGTYRYLFLVDGNDIIDPKGITITDAFGEQVSVLNAEREVKVI